MQNMEDLRRLNHVGEKFKCKYDLYVFNRDSMVSSSSSHSFQGFFLPDKKYCSLLFLQQIQAGMKLVFTQVQVNRVFVPKWPELSVKKMFPLFMTLPNARQYIPDDYCGDSKTPRDYFMAIFSTVAPTFVCEIIKDCRTQRMSLKEHQQQKMPKAQPVPFDRNFLKAMVETPFVSSKFL